MQEISKPTIKTFWIARNSDGSVLHMGETNPNQVTSTGQEVFEYSEDEAEQLAFVRNYTSQLPELPTLGEWVEGGVAYNYNGTPVKCIPPGHWRTADEPEDIPALFTTPAIQGEPWQQPTGGDGKYELGAIVTHNGKTWENVLEGTLNVWEPGVVPESYWKER